MTSSQTDALTPSVKPLAWDDRGEAWTPFGPYKTYWKEGPNGEDQCCWRFRQSGAYDQDDFGHGVEETEEAALAAINAHYRSVVLNAAAPALDARDAVIADLVAALGRLDNLSAHDAAIVCAALTKAAALK